VTSGVAKAPSSDNIGWWWRGIHYYILSCIIHKMFR